MFDFSQLKQIIATNQFAQGGFVIAIIGGAIAWAKDIPLTIYNKIKEQLIFSVEFDNKTEFYHVFNDFFNKNKKLSEKSSLSLKMKNNNIEYSASKNRPYYTRSPGFLISIKKITDDDDSAGDDKTRKMSLKKEVIYVKTAIFNKAKLKMFFNNIKDEYLSEHNSMTKIQFGTYGSWAGGAVWHQVSNKVWHRVNSQVDSQVGDQVGGGISNQIRDQIEEDINEKR